MFAVSKNNPHRGGILTCAHMLPPSSQRKSTQREDFELGLCASHHLKNNPPKGRIPKRWDKNPVQEILPEGRIMNRVLLIEGYLHVSKVGIIHSPPLSGKFWSLSKLCWWKVLPSHRVAHFQTHKYYIFCKSFDKYTSYFFSHNCWLICSWIISQVASVGMPQ